MLKTKEKTAGQLSAIECRADKFEMALTLMLPQSPLGRKSVSAQCTAECPQYTVHLFVLRQATFACRDKPTNVACVKLLISIVCVEVSLQMPLPVESPVAMMTIKCYWGLVLFAARLLDSWSYV